VFVISDELFSEDACNDGSDITMAPVPSVRQ